VIGRAGLHPCRPRGTRLICRQKTSHEVLHDLRIQLYADGADKAGILDLYAKPYIKGLTTNPTLMKKAGIRDYEAFARDILQTVTAKPISLEVFTDDLTEMKRQALKISGWGSNVYTKIPITNSRGESCLPLIRELGREGVKLNVTALLTLRQVGRRGGVVKPSGTLGRLGIRWAHRRYRRGPDAADARLRCPVARPAQGGVAVGQHA
jgi:hypothetical protein